MGSGRNACNNKRNKESNNLVRTGNNRLRKNYRILKTLNPDGKTRTSRSKMRKEVLDFDHIKHLHTQKGSTYYFVYDHGYLPLEKRVIYRQENRPNASS